MIWIASILVGLVSFAAGGVALFRSLVGRAAAGNPKNQDPATTIAVNQQAQLILRPSATMVRNSIVTTVQVAPVISPRSSLSSRLNGESRPSKTMLYVAAGMGNIELARTAIANGANLNVQDPEGNTLLIKAAQGGNKDIVELLLDNGAVDSINKKNIHGQTALHLAAQGGHRAIVKALLAGGADQTIVDKYGRTPMEYGVRTL